MDNRLTLERFVRMNECDRKEYGETLRMGHQMSDIGTLRTHKRSDGEWYEFRWDGRFAQSFYSDGYWSENLVLYGGEAEMGRNSEGLYFLRDKPIMSEQQYLDLRKFVLLGTDNKGYASHVIKLHTLLSHFDKNITIPLTILHYVMDIKDHQKLMDVVYALEASYLGTPLVVGTRITFIKEKE